MKEFLEYILKSIVKNPEEVVVTESKEDTLYTYSIKVAQSDMGIVIGKEGRTIKSIREMAIAKAIKEQKRVNVLLLEDNAQI
jgi:predicted RNA-binding protein YlqC (UPF0109 family)